MLPHSKEFVDSLTPKTAFEFLKEGNQNFVANHEYNHNLSQQVTDTAKGQHPFAVVLSCMDSRTSVELTFDRGIGELFSIRIAGNVSNDDVLGSMEYACGAVGSKLLVVLGHTSCGAVKGACEGKDLSALPHLPQLLKKIQPAIDHIKNKGVDVTDPSFNEEVAKANVLLTIEEILNKSKKIKELFDTKAIGIVGGIYDVKSGKVEFIKELF